MESWSVGERGTGLSIQDPDRPTIQDSRAWLIVLAVSLGVAGVYWFIDSRSTLWDRDEPRFARATAEMIESGNYLYPTFDGRLRPDKPILIYWLMSVPMRVLGPTPLACRFFSSVGIVLTCLFTFLLGRRFLGVQAGLWSMAVLASSLMILLEGTAAIADGILLPCMVAVLVLFARDLSTGRRWYDGAAMGLALGLGLLAKGPVALLPLVVILVTLGLSRRSGIRISRHLVPLGGAAVLGLLMFLAWALPANHATGGEFLRRGLGHHVLARAARPLDEHGGHFLLYLPYYLPVIAAGFFPWTLHLPGAISALLHGRVGSARFRELFLAWTISVVLIMTLVTTKLPHYILFIWPALALAVGGTLAAAAQGKLAELDRNWLRGGIYFFGPMAVVTVAAFLAAPWWLHWPGAIVPFWVAAGILAAVSVLAMRQQLQNRPQASAVTLLVGVAVLLFPVVFGILPAFERAKISPALAAAIKQKTAPEVPVATFAYDEPTLYFHVERQVKSLGDEHEDFVVAWAGQPEPGVLVIPRARLAEIERGHGSLGLTELASRKGVNYANGKAIEVAALLRRGSNP